MQSKSVPKAVHWFEVAVSTQNLCPTLNIDASFVHPKAGALPKDKVSIPSQKRQPSSGLDAGVEQPPATVLS